MKLKYVKHNIGSWVRLNSNLIPIVIIIICVIAMLILQAVTIGKQSEQIERQNNAIKQTNKLLSQSTHNAAERTKQIRDLQDHIDCIVLLFQKPSRASLVISDVENCKIKQVTTSTSETTPKTATIAPKESTPKPITTPKTSTTPSPATVKNKNFFDRVLDGVRGLIKKL